MGGRRLSAKFGEFARLHDEKAFAARNELMRRTMTRRERREVFAKLAEMRSFFRGLAQDETFRQAVIHHKKYFKGRASKDPTTAKAWAFLGRQSPVEVVETVRLMPDPPGQGGRPVGTGLQAQDEELLKEVRPLVDAGLMTPRAAARKLAPRAGGGGTPESKERRLYERLIQGSPENNPPQD